MSTAANPRATLASGLPCPNGCTLGWPKHHEPELLETNADGELSCPTCWEYLGVASAEVLHDTSALCGAAPCRQAKIRRPAAHPCQGETKARHLP